MYTPAPAVHLRRYQDSGASIIWMKRFFVRVFRCVSRSGAPTAGHQLPGAYPLISVLTIRNSGRRDLYGWTGALSS